MIRLHMSLWLRCEGKLIPRHDTNKLINWSQQPIGITENITSHWKLKVKTGNQYEARENASNRIAVGSRFASDWLERWHEFF